MNTRQPDSLVLRRRQLLQLGGATLGTALAGSALAQDYPNRPIKWIVPFAAGGGGDTTARLTAREVEKLVAQPLVIENRPGASTIIGVQALLSAPSDGYTIFSGNDSLATNLYLMDKLPYKLDDLVGLSVISKSPLALVSRPDFPATDLAGALQHIKAQAGKLAYGTWGIGSASHLAMESLLDRVGSTMVHVPFGGSAPALLAMVGGQMDIMFMDVGTSAQHVRAGKLKMWAVSTKERNPAFPDVPALGEAVLPGYEMYSWNGVLAKKGTPAAVVRTLSQAIQTVLAKPDFRKDQLERGNVPWGSTAQELDALLQANARSAQEIIGKRNIRLA